MQAPGPKPPRRLGLSGKLLLLTIPLVMIAGLMIYVPAIANFRLNRLNDRLAAANTAALVLDAAPSGMVPDSLARQILNSVGARAVAIKMGQQRRLLASADLPEAIDHDIDMRTMTAWSAIVDSFETMLETGNHAIRVVGPAPGGAQFIEVVIDERPLRQAMYRFSRNLLVVSLGIGMLTAGLVYLALALSVRAADAAADGQPRRLPRKPGKRGADHRAEPARRRDRRGGARIVRHATRSRLDAASEEPARGARSCGLQDQSRSAQSSRILAAAVRSTRQRAGSAGTALCTEADAFAGACHRVLPVDAVLRPRAGGLARPPHDPGRACGGRSARIGRA